MAIATVTAPTNESYPIHPSFVSTITQEERDRMGALAGRKVRHYHITPQQAILITAVALGVTAIVASIALSPLAWIIVAAAAGVGIYCIYRKDMDSANVRKQEALELAKLTPLQLVQKEDKLTTLIDYDLGLSESREARLKSYILLTHLQTSYRSLLESKRLYEKRVQATVIAVSEEPKTRALELKEEPQRLAQEEVARADLLRRNLASNLELLNQKEAALRGFSLHNTPREAVQPQTEAPMQRLPVENRPEVIALMRTIADLKATIAETQKAIERADIERRKKETEVSHIQIMLRQALIPLTNWEYAANMSIRKSLDDATKQLETYFNRALNSENTSMMTASI